MQENANEKVGKSRKTGNKSSACWSEEENGQWEVYNIEQWRDVTDYWVDWQPTNDEFCSPLIITVRTRLLSNRAELTAARCGESIKRRCAAIASGAYRELSASTCHFRFPVTSELVSFVWWPSVFPQAVNTSCTRRATRRKWNAIASKYACHFLTFSPSTRIRIRVRIRIRLLLLLLLLRAMSVLRSGCCSEYYMYWGFNAMWHCCALCVCVLRECSSRFSVLLLLPAQLCAYSLLLSL